MDNKIYDYKKIPCKVGDMILLTTECSNISTDNQTSDKDCPFKKDCHFENCDINNKRKFIVPIEKIYNSENKLKIKLKNLKCVVNVEDLGISAYIVRG